MVKSWDIQTSLQNFLSFLKLQVPPNLQPLMLPLDTSSLTSHPLRRKGSLQDVSNFRPISRKFIISGKMGRFVRDGTIDRILPDNLLTAGKHGFLGLRSRATRQWDHINLLTGLNDCGSMFVVVCFLTRSMHLALFHTRISLPNPSPSASIRQVYLDSTSVLPR